MAMAVRFMCGAEDLLLSGGHFVWNLAERIFRKWYTRGMRPCQRFVHNWCHYGELYQMTEGRVCQVHLLDDRKLELLVQPKLLSRDLLDLVSSHFNLKEKEYFGISFIDDTGQRKWLQMDRRVLEHDFCKKTGPIALKFLVRFYIEKITFLKENTTVELFFLNAKSSVYNWNLKGDIEVESENVFKLAAYTLQEAKGDYTSDEATRTDLKKLPTLPTRVLKEHPSLAYCEDRVIEHYKALKGLTRGQAVVQYLALVESLPTYGVHYYGVKDKQGIPWWLGMSYKGIGQYDLQDKLKPRKLYQWKQLENLYFREKKFAVEVNDPHRRRVSKRTFGQTGLVIHTWYASHSLIKTIWVMAISQHQFYLDRKQSKAKITTARSLGDIAMDLTEVAAPRLSKLGSLEVKNQLIMASNGSLVSTGSADSEVNEEQKKEKICELKKKGKELEGVLAQKVQELKELCLREAKLTGRLPKEYPLSSGEKAPHVRRRVGTTFKLDDLFPYDEDPHLRNLESRFALQQKIVEAAKKLAGEAELGKTVRKKRSRNCRDAMRKLQEIEDEINGYRVKTGKKPTQRASLIMADDCTSVCAELCSLSDSLTLDDDVSVGVQRQRSRSVQYSPGPSLSEDLGINYLADRRASANSQHIDMGLNRLNYSEVQEPLHYGHRDTLSTHSSPYKLPSRQARDAHSMPPTPVMTRNAYSSIQLRSEEDAQLFRQRSGSLESQSQFLTEAVPPNPTFTLSPARRSNSTEVLDDGSSYTSQSSVEYSYPGNPSSRPRGRWRHRKANIYANTGSMPNLAQNDDRCYAPSPDRPPRTTSPATPATPDSEPYSNGAYVYESELEGHYNVNPSYHAPAYRGHDRYGHYADDEVDGFAQNPYATLRPPRNRAGPRGEQLAKNFQKALVAEHLRGWYNRNTGHKHVSYDYDRGSQQSLGYQTMPAPFGHSSRTTSYSSVSSAASAGNWRSQLAVGLTEYDVPPSPQQPYPGSYSTAYSSNPSYSRYGSCQLSECPCHSAESQQRCAFVPASPSSSSSSSSVLSSLPPSSPRCMAERPGSAAQQPQSYRKERLNKYPHAKCSPRYVRNGSYVDVNQMETPTCSQINSSLDPEDQRLHWHEDSKPGTIV
ncbi:hypothetical protein SKAU_G00177590 [Synaphobranchus kaupii]|uniref:FERM domain-containing protein n=1 Tax=Synaphobranchus kaupii TaxID=118154 RepID=A0A9Q1FLN8_SYNKA|nr:hypothetical protein SKAU_G00177590 [Synaphobranchus kaupii]